MKWLIQSDVSTKFKNSRCSASSEIFVKIFISFMKTKNGIFTSGGAAFSVYSVK